MPIPGAPFPIGRGRPSSASTEAKIYQFPISNTVYAPEKIAVGAENDKGHFSSSALGGLGEEKWPYVRIGRGDVQVVEPPDAIKTVLVRWNGVKLDLTKLARLRWIEKLTTPEICNLLGKRRSAIRLSIRTIRNSGLSGLNLTEFEKITVKNQIILEEAKFGRKRQ